MAGGAGGSLPEVVGDAAILVDPSDVAQIADRSQKSEGRGQRSARGD
jgi:hypothetical protein